MKIRRVAGTVVVLASFVLLAGGFIGDQSPSSGSRVIRLEPASGKPGDTITAFGEHLDRAHVEDLHLTDGEWTALVRIVNQNEKSIQFRIPTTLVSGRYKVVLAPAGHYGRVVEQQVILTVL